MKWFEQEKGFGLGNFIMATPALRFLGENQPISVFFNDSEIASVYRKCPFIKILDRKPVGKSLATTSTAKKFRKRHESDSETLFRIMARKSGLSSKACLRLMPKTYIDYEVTKKLDKIPGKKYVAVFHGCLGNIYRDKKDIGIKTRQYVIDSILSRGFIPVVLGNISDKKRYWKKNSLRNCLVFLGQTTLKDCISILGQCNFFISNDTGLYHAAGALGINGLVLWKDTDSRRNRSTYNGISHVQCRDGNFNIYKKHIDNFLKSKK